MELRISICKKFELRTCPYMDRPEMQKAIVIYSEKEPSESASGFNPIAVWEDLIEANNKFCIDCNQFEDLLRQPDG